jgi:hypothetical protein
MKAKFKMATVVETIKDDKGRRIDVLSCGHQKRHYDYYEEEAEKSTAARIRLMGRELSGESRKTRCYECGKVADQAKKQDSPV